MFTNPVSGQGNARNAGWKSAHAEIVAYLDDDCYPADDFLDSVVECFAEAPNLGFISGRILLYDQTDRRMTIQESVTRVSLAPYSFILPGIIQGANSAFRRASLAEVDGFDPRFGGAKGQFLAEELDVAARISAAGWHGAYDPRPLVYHHHGRKTRFEEWRLVRVYQRGIGGFYAKCLFDTRLRGLFLANFRSIRKRHSYRGMDRHSRCSNRLLCARYLPDRQRIGGSHTDEADTPGFRRYLSRLKLLNHIKALAHQTAVFA